MRVAGIIVAGLMAIIAAGCQSSREGIDQFLSPPLTTNFPIASPSVSVETLRHGLMEVLGDSFEYLGSEIRTAELEPGSSSENLFWFARVRAKAAGNFAFSYSFRFDYRPSSLPDNSMLTRLVARRAMELGTQDKVCTVPISIGPREGTRFISGGGVGPAWPLANVGDTIVIPIEIGPDRIDFRFSKVDISRSNLQYYFADWAELGARWNKIPPEDRVNIRNDGSEWVRILDGWHVVSPDEPVFNFYHSLNARVAFLKPGGIEIRGHLEGALDDRIIDSQKFRVVQADRGIIVMVEYCMYTGPGFLSGGEIMKPPAMYEVRVGDLTEITCGSYRTRGSAKWKDSVLATQPSGLLEVRELNPGF
jgi:hypothetical protein